MFRSSFYGRCLGISVTLIWEGGGDEKSPFRSNFCELPNFNSIYHENDLILDESNQRNTVTKTNRFADYLRGHKTFEILVKSSMPPPPPSLALRHSQLLPICYSPYDCKHHTFYTNLQIRGRDNSC